MNQSTKGGPCSLLDSALWAPCLLAMLLTSLPGSAALASGEHATTGTVTYVTGPKLQFDSEVVRLYVSEDSLRVDGLYRIACTESTHRFTHLLYPYPVEPEMGAARTLLLEARVGDGPWSPATCVERPEDDAVRWTIPVRAGETTEVRTVYSQDLLAKQARYITMTTRLWKQPLREARFEAYLPKSIENPDFSYAFDRLQADGQDLWVYETKEFWPEEDLIIRWD